MAHRSKALGFAASMQNAVQHAGVAAGDIQACSGMPKLDRAVTIFAPARSPMTQGSSKIPSGDRKPCWRISYGTLEKWSNPIIGWTSTADPVENVARAALQFGTKEDAVAYCVKYGLSYTLREQPAKYLGRPKKYPGYGDNFHVKRKGIPEGGLRSMDTPAPAAGKAGKKAA